MATSPRTDFALTPLPAPEAAGVKIAELVRLQKFAQRINSSLDLDEIVQRIPGFGRRAQSALPTKSPPLWAVWKSIFICTTPPTMTWFSPACVAARCTARDIA